MLGLRDYWAKTLRSPSGRDVPGISVRDHCMNVGCVAEALIAALSEQVRPLLPPGAACLAALHDIGKVCPGFQAKCDAWILQHELVAAAVAGCWKLACETDHARVSQWIVQELFAQNEELFGWAVAVGAHHGRLKGARVRRNQELRGGIGDSAWDAVRQTIARELIGRFGPLPEVPPLEATLWWLAGLVTVADWIGSDETWFPPDGSLPDDQRPACAANALNAIPWRAVALKPDLEFSSLFPGLQPTPLQRAAFEQIVRPGTYLVEGAMGCGKTEAALGAAYRLMAAGQASGLYFALPTQTTSNKIHERVEAFLQRVELRPQALRLAHGSAWLREDWHVPVVSAAFADPRALPGRRLEEDEQSVARDHTRAARSWFAGAKRALLATFGVGTVDQALMGIVAAKHFFVRQFGLAGKVVVLDEIHTYDLYTGTLLDKLVERLRELRCTVLILSATLTARRRQELLSAARAEAIAKSNAYPLLTLAPEQAEPRAVPFPVTERKAVRIVPTFESQAQVAERCLARAQAGQCVLWICNTVDDAQASYRQLKSAARQGGPPLGLLHARFPLWRREALESRWLEVLGKSSTHRPAGCVLVATQVVEQSVDIDADFLVTDLAPTDLLLQRMGRLWRHERPGRSGLPEMWICTGGLNPANVRSGSAAELKALLGRSSFVYAPYVLLRTFDVWQPRSQVTLPDDIRPLLEATYAEPAAETPEAWLALYHQLQGSRKTLRESALNAALVRRQPALADEEGVQTRWNSRPTAQVLLAASAPVDLPDHTTRVALVDGSEALWPKFGFNLQAARALHRNLVRVPAWMVQGFEATAPPWLESLVPQKTMLGRLRPEDGAVLLGERASGMVWHPDEGIVFARIDRPRPEMVSSILTYDDDEPYD